MLALLSLPCYSAARAAAAGRNEAIPVLVGWGMGILALLAAYRWEKRGGTGVVIASLLTGAVLLAGYKGMEPMLDLIVTLLLLLTGILFLQCGQRKAAARGR